MGGDAPFTTSRADVFHKPFMTPSLVATSVLSTHHNVPHRGSTSLIAHRLLPWSYPDGSALSTSQRSPSLVLPAPKSLGGTTNNFCLWSTVPLLERRFGEWSATLCYPPPANTSSFVSFPDSWFPQTTARTFLLPVPAFLVNTPLPVATSTSACSC